MTISKLLALALLALFLAACGGQTIPDPEPTETTVDGSEDAGAETDGWGEDGLGEGEDVDWDGEDQLAMVIYFGFDQSEIRAEDQATLEQHATKMANNPSASVRLEGHADERGSREYNIGLGERRSQAVRKLLLIQGASASQITTVSFGEERPAAFGSDEESYSQNRRVEIKYPN